VIRVLMLVLLLMLGTAIWQTLGPTPAFNPSAVAETVVGNGRVAVTEAMYDPAAYAFQRGYGFLMADSLISGETESRDEIALENTAFERAVKAQIAIEEALRGAPGHAHAWAALAWAYARQGDDARALAALSVSWNIAPYNRALAETRLGLLGVLTEIDIEEPNLLPAQKVGILRDVEILERYDENVYTFRREANPRLFELIESWRSD